MTTGTKFSGIRGSLKNKNKTKCLIMLHTLHCYLYSIHNNTTTNNNNNYNI